ncbi:response regulator transcription factor [Paenibacillus paeoniae]|uniref:Helix-turn-helix domain-containing protein n=1 Tax=Paenibacillus paeoniae TaxID=2292705 RepID=A0A371PE12_9BACL|nr:helix-turn-helix domain-containing protein [Paenibacillus paeoniae]REK74183.1 helix-turn-helix domain-containing protein [Paenibacillus paeoniae]
MYRVLIVDDDVAVLTFLQTMVPWGQYGFSVQGAYTNARDALAACTIMLPDLVITDIGMPDIDGLAFIRMLKETSGHPRFLILSCHDEFKYAKQAVQLGVQDYVLKETLSTDVLNEQLERLHQSLAVEDHHQQKVEKLHWQASQSKSALKEQWLREYLAAPFSDQVKWRGQLADYGLKPELSHYIPVIGRVSLQEALVRYMNEDMVKFIIYNAAEELLQTESDVIFFPHTAKEFCLLFAFKKDLHFNPYVWVHGVCQMVQRSLSQTLKFPISFLIGEEGSDSERIRRQLAGLLRATDVFFYSGQSEILVSNQLLPLDNQEELLAYYPKYFEEVNQMILEGNKNVRPIADSFLKFIACHRFPPIAVKHFLIKLMLDVQMKLKFGHQYSNVKAQQHLEQMDHVSQLDAWMIHFLIESVSLMEQISMRSKKVEIIDAQKYILLNMDQKITLGEVAERLYLNSSYFSRLFKKETGENFIEYVNRVKMERAKELLSKSDMTVEEISQSLGYDNKGYFVKLFKDHYGVPPRQYI